MSKTSPVRWWRDDADRYRSRGAYVAPRDAPEVAECLARLRQRMIELAMMPSLRP